MQPIEIDENALAQMSHRDRAMVRRLMRMVRRATERAKSSRGKLRGAWLAERGALRRTLLHLGVLVKPCGCSGKPLEHRPECTAEILAEPGDSDAGQGSERKRRTLGAIHAAHAPSPRLPGSEDGTRPGAAAEGVTLSLGRHATRPFVVDVRVDGEVLPVTVCRGDTSRVIGENVLVTVEMAVGRESAGRAAE